MSCNTVPQIKFSPASLSFTIEEGDPVTHSLALRIENEGGAARHLEWELSTVASWLSFIPNQGVDTKVVVVRVNALGLTPGEYKNGFVISAQDSPNSPQLVPVSLTIEGTDVVPTQCENTIDILSLGLAAICQLPKGHSGLHQNKGDAGVPGLAIPYTLTWGTFTFYG
jgi:hypothetical protein